MVRRTTKWLVVLLAALLTGIVLAGGALAWRLGQGPVALDFLSPLVRQSLRFGDPVLSLTFSRLQMEWIGARHALKFVLRDIQILDEAGRPVGHAPIAYVGLSTQALARGEAALSSVTLSQPTLRLLRGLDGSLYPSAAPASRIGGEEPDADSGRILRSLAAAAKFLCDPADQQAQFGYLKRAGIRLAHLTIVDDRSGMEWVLPAVDAAISRQRGNLAMTLSGTAPQPGRLAQFSARGDFEAGKKATVSVRIQNAAPARLAGSAGFLKPLRALDMPLSGDFETVWSAAGGLQKAAFTLAAGAGHIVLPDLYPAPAPVQSLRLAGRYNPAAGLLILDKSEAELGQARLSANGQWSVKAGGAARLDAILHNLPVAGLPVYWPNRAVGARNWIAANLEGGVLPETKLRLRLPAGTAAGRLPDNAVSVAFSFHGMTAHFLRPMRPLTEGQGNGVLSADSFTLTLDHARADGLDVTDGRVVIGDLQSDGPQIAHIDLTLAGRTAEVLRLIDQKPLGYASAFGIDPATVGGSAITRLGLVFPTINALTMRQVQFHADADASDLAIAKLYDGLALDQGQIKLAITRDGIAAGGKILLNQTPFNVVWRENFNAAPGANSTLFQLDGELAGAQWARFGLPVQDYVDGPAHVRLALQGHGPVIASFGGEIDFTDAGVRIDRLSWAKAAGIAGHVTLQGESRPGRVQFNTLRWTGGGMEAALSGSLDDDFRPLAVSLDRLVTGRTNLAAALRRTPQGGYNLLVRGAALDAGGLIQAMNRPDPPPGREPRRSRPDFSFSVALEKVYLAQDVQVSGFAAHGGLIAQKWRSFDASGQFAGGAGFETRLADIGGVRKFTAQTGNAGDLLRGLDIFGNLYGGRMTLTGQIAETEPGAPLKGDAVLHDFRIQKAPGLAKLLTLASFTGIADTLAGGGISFGKLAGSFSWDDHNLKIGHTLAHGPAMGITGEGFMDRRQRTLFLSGSVAPSYTLNTAINHIPLIGQLITGGKGQGILGFNYRMSGPASNPDVSVNPLSAFTPGFLRGFLALFEGRKPQPQTPDVPDMVLTPIILPPREITAPPPLK